jgi:hypothetical protein
MIIKNLEFSDQLHSRVFSQDIVKQFFVLIQNFLLRHFIFQGDSKGPENNKIFQKIKKI